MRRAAKLLPQRDDASWVVVLAGLGVFFAADDQTSVVAVLPKMIDGVGLTQDQFFRAAWIVNGYILGYVIAMPLMGRVADAYGLGRVYGAALLLFCFGSAWVALSSDLTLLSVARAVQAVGGGAVVPVSMAIVMAHVAPERRALALGAMAAASEAGGLVGPLWGGGIAELIGWRGVFWINLPMCLPIAYAIWRFSRGEQGSGRRDLDLPGAALIGACLVCLTFALTDDPIEPREAWLAALLYGGAALFFAAFLLRQTRAPLPIVDLSLFRRAALSAGFLTNGLTGGALLSAMVAVPLFTNVILEESALQGGLNLMRLTIALPVGAFLGGVLTHRVGASVTAGLGLVCAGLGFIGMSGWSEDPSFVAMTLPLLVAGLGFGLVIAPVNTAVLDEVDEDDRATMASLLTIVRLIGALVGVALLTTRGLGGFYAEAGLIPLDAPRFSDLLVALEVDSFRDVFLAAAGVCFLTLLPAAFLGRRWRQA